MSEQQAAPLVFLDTETDGVHPDRKVWEVAMIRCDDKGQREAQFYVEIDLETSDPFGLKVGGFYDRHPMGRWLSGHGRSFLAHPEPDERSPDFVPASEAARRVARMTHGAHLVGAVPNFDAEVLAGLLRAWFLAPAWHYHLIDVEAMAVGYLAGADDGTGALRPPWKSDALSQAVGVEPPSEEEWHTAMGDARWAQRLYDAMIGPKP